MNILDKSSRPNKQGLWNYKNILNDVISGSSVFVGGFGDVGTPISLLYHLSNKNVDNLKIITESRLLPDSALRRLIIHKQISSFTTSYYKLRKEENELFNSGQIEFHVTPMGTLVEQIRAGGSGIPAFYTYTGADTVVELGGRLVKLQCDDNGDKTKILTQPIRSEMIKGRKALYYESLTADIAFIHAHTADKAGNLCFKGTGANLNDVMAMAGKVCIVEAEHIVEVGDLDPHHIHVPGIFVHRLIKCDNHFWDLKATLKLFPEVRIRPQFEMKKLIAQKIAEQIKEGEYVNIGVGTPMLVAQYCDVNNVVVQVENGMLGAGTEAGLEDRIFEVRGAESVPMFLSSKPGHAFFGSQTSFSMIRGGHINVTVLGSLEVAENGDFASWTSSGESNFEYNGMGGAMDLCNPPTTRVLIAMQHLTSKGRPRLVNKCRFPLTALGVVHTVVTEKAVFRVIKDKGFVLVSIHDQNETLESLRNITAAEITDGRGILN